MNDLFAWIDSSDSGYIKLDDLVAGLLQDLPTTSSRDALTKPNLSPVPRKLQPNADQSRVSPATASLMMQLASGPGTAFRTDDNG
ncbi:unnamed protein product [Protopolystoma xenopodis]|uniref:EF-hand domain-containing protein n=1 Tax=Protopolystoma xenopodis TaxID=117903 RepID=A0A448WSM6_9PLAT|nr:unnamed protein product [Protopolystoma xenopodis]